MKNGTLKLTITGGTVALSLLLAIESANALTKTAPDRTNAALADAVAPVAKASPISTNLAPAAPMVFPAAPTEEDIRDIRQPRHQPTPWPWVVIAAGVLALIAGVLAIRHWLHHGKFFEMTPIELALQRLEEARRLMDPDQAREYCFEVSKIIRDYIEGQLNLRAPQLTTEEFLRELVDNREAILAAHRARLGDFLKHCDLAKFAGWRYSLPALENLHVSALEFVRHSSATPATVTPPRTITATTTATNTTSTTSAPEPIPANQK